MEACTRTLCNHVWRLNGSGNNGVKRMTKTQGDAKGCWWNCEDRSAIAPLAIAFIISMGFALNPIVFRNYKMPYVIQVAVTCFWIFIAFIFWLRDRRRLSTGDGRTDKSRTRYGKIASRFAIPKILIWAYGLALFATGVANPTYASTGYTQMASILLPLSALYIFRSDALKYIYIACVASFVPIVVFTCLGFGLQSLAAPFLSIVEPEIMNPFENHEFTFTAAYLFVYFSCIDERPFKEKFHQIFVSGVMSLIGFKRILALSVLLVLAVHFLLIHLNGPARMRACKLIAGALAVGCSLFVWSIYSGQFFALMDKLGIQTMGRIYYYKVVTDNTSFSPSFLGMGLNSVSRMLTQDYSYLHVGGVHSDVLKYYAEIGFVGFFLWLWVYLFRLPRYIADHFGPRAFYAMSLINIFTFTSFLTDNIDIYLGSQLLYIVIPITVAMRGSLGGRSAERAI